METNTKPEKKTLVWRKLIVDKFSDLVIVILGITIAFQLEAWKVESNQQSLEQFYLESMASDLQKDIDLLERNLEDFKSDLSLVGSVEAKMKNGAVAPDTLGNAILNAVGFSTFNQSSNTYEMLVSGNGLNAISDRATRSLISEYYSRYSGIRRFESVYTELIFRVFANFNTSIDFAQKKVVDASIVKKMETKNYLLMIEAQLNDGIENYEDALKNARALAEKIKINLAQ